MKHVDILKQNTPHKGWRVKRTAHPSSLKEKVFAEAWADECEPKYYVNYGQGLLQDLFITQDPKYSWMSSYVAVMSKRDKMIVATVVQWLGSNCGWAFLDTTLRKMGYKIVKIEEDGV